MDSKRPRIAAAFVALALFGGAATFLGCHVISDTANNIDEATDCDQVCARYADCFDSQYDQSTCRARCENRAATVTGFADDLDACENCMDDKACSEASFNCSGTCDQIVP
ncbi:MAG: hypothetical protein U0414_44510 [Polyangiaceae bacterium]